VRPLRSLHLHSSPRATTQIYAFAGPPSFAAFFCPVSHPLARTWSRWSDVSTGRLLPRSAPVLNYGVIPCLSLELVFRDQSAAVRVFGVLGLQKFCFERSPVISITHEPLSTFRLSGDGVHYLQASGTGFPELLAFSYESRGSLFSFCFLLANTLIRPASYAFNSP